MTDPNSLLKAGVQALKSGRRNEARQLLMQVVELDEGNEIAWLWLSGAVDTDEDRRICLENVLALNPDNKAAQKGLARLGPAEPLILEPPPIEPEPLAAPGEETPQPAASRPEEPEPRFDPPPLIIDNAAERHFDDVWSKDGDICAYCATTVAPQETHCPGCRRKMRAKVLLNPFTSHYHRNLLYIMGGFTFLPLIGALVFLLISGIDIPLLVPTLVISLLCSSTPYLVLMVGIYFRQVWAYWLMLPISFLATGGFFLALALSLPSLDAGAPLPIVLICLSPFIAFFLFFLYTTYMAGGDFKRVWRRQVVSVVPGLKNADVYDQIAKEMAKDGKWATAIAYWRHAAGRSPGHPGYLRRLAQGYARLGFFERGIDTLQTAFEKSHSPEMKVTLKHEIEEMQARAAAPAAEAADRLLTDIR